MNFQDELAKTVKDYLGEDLDEKIIKDGHVNIIQGYFEGLRRKIGTVKSQSYNIVPWSTDSKFLIEDITFNTRVNTENNTIEVTKVIDGKTTPIDTIIVQDGELIAVNRNEKFTTEILEEYLRETFGEKLGL
ncbi:DUF3942 family protein [Bacillus sp. GM_Baccil_2]|uniref:DUF3942 family protein n=1 Tax=Bacillus sp. GM_Baccil_2 TaxID=2937369 RepID=UPI002269EC2D